MSWITVIWSMSASACLLVASMHILIWSKRERGARANGTFAMLALATFVYSTGELWIMRAETVDEMARAIRWIHLPAFIVIVASITFIRFYLNAGRNWLAWTIIGLRSVVLAVNFLVSPNINYSEISTVRHIQFLGETVSMPLGTISYWQPLTQFSLFLSIIFVVDATIQVWRRGDRPHARWLTAAFTFFLLAATVQVLLVFSKAIEMPIISSLFFSGIVLVMGLDLSWDLIRSSALAEELKESEDRLRALTEATLEGLMIHDRAVILDVNSAFVRLFGYDHRDELVGVDKSKQLLKPTSLERVQRRIAHREQGIIEVECIRKDGTTFIAEIEAREIKYLGHDARIVSWRDITHRKLSETLAQGQNQILEMIARDAPVPETLESLLHVIEAQDNEMLCSILLLDSDGSHLRHGAATQLPASFTDAVDGIEIGPAVGSCGTAAYEGRQVIVEDIETAPLWVEYKDLALAHGLRACWSTPIFDEQEKVLGTFAVYYRSPRAPSERDLKLILSATHLAAIALGRDRAKAALAASDSQLRQSQKMEAIGVLAGGIAHDFNNLLTAITGFSDLTLMKMGFNDPLRKNIVEVLEAGNRAAELTSQLLAFSRKQVQRTEVLSLNEIVSNIEKMLRRIIEESIELRIRLAGDLGNVRADPGQVEQVIMNLAINARDAMPNGGSLTIETRNTYLDESYVSQHIDTSPGPFVELVITDTGVGIPADIKPNIFEPFFTTKEVGKGTGLGLSTVYGIVKQSGGDILVYSEVNVGTTFKVYFPCVDESLPQRRRAAVTGQDYTGSETILLAEDEITVRKLVLEILTRGGYKVLEAESGAAAVALCESFGERIDLLLTDMVMPKMGGIELREKIVAMRPDIKVMFMSGYTDDSISNSGPAVANAAFLEKPFTPDTLAMMVREVLDGI